MTSDFEGFSISDFILYIYFPLLILEKDAVLDWGLNPGPPVLDANTLPIGYRGGGEYSLIWNILGNFCGLYIDTLGSII